MSFLKKKRFVILMFTCRVTAFTFDMIKYLKAIV